MDLKEEALAAARAAAAAALAGGAIDRLQAEALPALLEAGEDADLAAAAMATFAGRLSEVTRALLEATRAAAAELENEESEAQLEDLAALVATVGGRLQQARRRTDAGGERPPEMYASARWRTCLEKAVRHLKEARDQIDDGMPADAAALEARAAEQALLKALG